MAKHILWNFQRSSSEVLIPSGVVIEGGDCRWRLRKLLQIEGVPFYELSETGLLVASSIEEVGPSRTKMLESYIKSLPSGTPDYEIMREGILLLIRSFHLSHAKLSMNMSCI